MPFLKVIKGCKSGAVSDIPSAVWLLPLGCDFTLLYSDPSAEKCFSSILNWSFRFSLWYNSITEQTLQIRTGAWEQAQLNRITGTLDISNQHLFLLRLPQRHPQSSILTLPSPCLPLSPPVHSFHPSLFSFLSLLLSLSQLSSLTKKCSPRPGYWELGFPNYTGFGVLDERCSTEI